MVNVDQKLQELKQLLLSHPLKVILTLLLSRFLGLPLLRGGGHFGRTWSAVSCRGFPLRVHLWKTSKRLQVIIGDYLEETLELIVEPPTCVIRTALRLLAGALSHPVQLVRVLD